MGKVGKFVPQTMPSTPHNLSPRQMLDDLLEKPYVAEIDAFNNSINLIKNNKNELNLTFDSIK